MMNNTPALTPFHKPFQLGDRVWFRHAPDWLLHDLPQEDQSNILSYVGSPATIDQIDSLGYYWLAFDFALSNGFDGRRSFFCVSEECIEHPPTQPIPITIRPTQAADTALLPAIERSAAQTFYQIPELAWIAQDHVMEPHEHLACVRTQTSWVAQTQLETKKIEVVGFIAAQIIDGYLYIAELAVLATHQRMSIGKQLVQAALAHARRQQLKAVTLTTFIHVPWNMPWYASLGFKVIADDEIPPWLKTIQREEVRHGLDAHTRCAMILNISAGASTVDCKPCEV